MRGRLNDEDLVANIFGDRRHVAQRGDPECLRCEITEHSGNLRVKSENPIDDVLGGVD